MIHRHVALLMSAVVWMFLSTMWVPKACSQGNDQYANGTFSNDFGTIEVTVAILASSDSTEIDAYSDATWTNFGNESAVINFVYAGAELDQDGIQKAFQQITEGTTNEAPIPLSCAANVGSTYTMSMTVGICSSPPPEGGGPPDCDPDDPSCNPGSCGDPDAPGDPCVFFRPPSQSPTALCSEEGETYSSSNPFSVSINTGYPHISSVSPSSVNQNSSGPLTITGSNLVDAFGNSSVRFSASGVTGTVANPNSPNQITVNYTAQPNATTGDGYVFVSTNFGESDGKSFTVGDPPATVTSVDPPIWLAGTTFPVTIQGTGFGTQPTVTLSAYGVAPVTNTVTSNGTTINLPSVNVTPNAPNEPVGITVQPGYAGSTFTCGNCNGSSPNGTGGAMVQAITPVPQIMMVNSLNDLTNCQNGVATKSGNGESNVFAGQQMLLCVLPPPPPLKIVSSNWTFDDVADISGGFTNTAGNGAPSANNDTTGGGQESADPDLTKPGIMFYFPNPNSHETATFHWTLNNGDASGNESSADFFIDGPTAVTVAAPEQATQLREVDTPSGNAVSVDIFYQMGIPIIGKPGILFTIASSPPTSVAGDHAGFTWVQTLTDVFQYRESSQYEQCASIEYPTPVLDNLYPYPSRSETTAADSPRSSTLGIKGEGENARVFRATTYLMWDPALPSGCSPAASKALGNGQYQTSTGNCASIPIPIGSVQWSSCADAINTLNPSSGVSGWTLGCSVPKSANDGPALSEGGDFPQWQSAANTAIIINGKQQVENAVCKTTASR